MQLGLAALIMVVLISISGSSSSSEQPEEVRLHPTVDGGAARRIGVLYAGIPQHGVVLGHPNAPVTLQFFGDLECKEARQFTIGALPYLIRSWVRDGKLRIVYRANPEETIWQDIYVHQQVATLAAGSQNRAWTYLDFFYHEQGPEFTRYATNHFLRSIARRVRGLDIERWVAERHEVALVRHLKRDLAIARRHSISSTPAFLVGPTGGEPRRILHYSLTESAAFDEAIEEALNSA